MPTWPELIPDYTPETVEIGIEAGAMIVGDPDEALAQCRRWEEAGLDQLVFGIGPASLDDTLEMIRLLGEHVIPKIDTDPEHRTSRQRATARSSERRD